MNLIPIAMLARELGVHKDYALRLVKRRSPVLGLHPVRGSRNSLSLTREDADRVIDDYRPRHQVLDSGQLDQATRGFGFFYVIQLHPEDLPRRLKIGFTDSLRGRGSDHRTIAPTLRYVKVWRCKRSWEEAAIACVTKSECVQIGREVFDGDVALFVERADQFFSLMPKPDGREGGEPGATDNPDDAQRLREDH